MFDDTPREPSGSQHPRSEDIEVARTLFATIAEVVTLTGTCSNCVRSLLIHFIIQSYPRDPRVREHLQQVFDNSWKE